ncbi:MAG: hypothetical protein K2Y40_24030 [Reyranella sp.]|nr:hypothetical protein [Reyranella sp.]
MKASCVCGAVTVEATGAPIVANICYCDDCQAGARRIALLGDGPDVAASDGGTAYLLYREDRLRCTAGADRLQAVRLTPGSATRRHVASCCNAAMYMDFADSRHWVSAYRDRFPANAPPPEMRICTKYRPGAVPLAPDIPNHSGYPARFMMRLVGAWMAMKLGR